MAQNSPATPIGPDDRVSKAFEFYPKETGYGSYIDLLVDPGESVQVTVLIANTGEASQDLRTYAVNAFTADGGGFAAAEYGTEPNEVTSWLDYSEEIYTIQTGTGTERTFSLTVPPNQLPGQYITALVAEHADPSAIEGTTDVVQKLRYLLPIFITVPGNLSGGFEVNNVTLSSQLDSTFLSVDLENTGNVRIRPQGTVELLDQSGELVSTFPVSMDSVYAFDETSLTFGIAGAVSPGTYQVQVSLSDPETGTSATAAFTDLVVDSFDVTSEQATISIMNSSVSPSPDVGNVQFGNVQATLSNFGDPVTNAQLSLIASVDGAEVERFPISQSLSLPTGETPVTTRYIPATGWTAGTWTFELLLETVEPSGAAVVVGRQAINATITIP